MDLYIQALKIYLLIKFILPRELQGHTCPLAKSDKVITLVKVKLQSNSVNSPKKGIEDLCSGEVLRINDLFSCFWFVKWAFKTYGVRLGESNFWVFFQVHGYFDWLLGLVSKWPFIIRIFLTLMSS